MDITKLDVTILVAMSTAIILMSLTFPALGLGGDEAQESDIPQYNTSGQQFDVVGDFPRQPGTPTSGFLYWEEALAGNSDNTRWLEGSEAGGCKCVTLGALNSTINGTSVTITRETSGGTVNQTWAKWPNDTVGRRQAVDVYGYEMVFELESLEYVDNGTGEDFTVSYNINGQEPSDSWYNRLPIVGAAIPSTEQITGMIGWLGSVLYWAVGTTYEIIANYLLIVIEIITYFADLVGWLTGTYESIVSAGSISGWARAILTIPGILLGVVLAKLAIVVVEVVWIG